MGEPSNLMENELSSIRSGSNTANTSFTTDSIGSLLKRRGGYKKADTNTTDQKLRDLYQEALQKTGLFAEEVRGGQLAPYEKNKLDPFLNTFRTNEYQLQDGGLSADVITARELVRKSKPSERGTQMVAYDNAIGKLLETNPLNMFSKTYASLLKTIPNIDSNFVSNGKFACLAQDGRPISKKIHASLTDGLNARILLSPDSDTILYFRAHILTSKICLALNSLARATRSLAKLEQYFTATQSLKDKKANRITESIVKSLGRDPIPPNPDEINPAEKRKINMSKLIEPRLINIATNNGLELNGLSKQKKELNIKKRFGSDTTLQDYNLFMKKRSKIKDIKNSDATLRTVGYDGSWADFTINPVNELKRAVLFSDG